MNIRKTALILAILVSVAGAVFRDNPFIRHAQDYAQSVAITAAATYVTLRTLNAVLSTAQEFEVGVSFIASGTAQPLKVLEPIDDTVERIAALVFGVMVVTSVIAVALGPVSAIGLALFATALALGLTFSKTRGEVLQRLAWYGGFLGVALPLVLIIASPLAEALTGAKYAEQIAIIDDITANVGATDALTEDEPGFAQYRQLAGNITSRADELINAMLGVLGVYIFQLFILPMLLIGGVFMAMRYGARSPISKGAS